MTAEDIIVGQLYHHTGIDSRHGTGAVLYLGCGTYDTLSGAYVDRFLVVIKCPFGERIGNRVGDPTYFWSKFQLFTKPATIEINQ